MSTRTDETKFSAVLTAIRRYCEANGLSDYSTQVHRDKTANTLTLVVTTDGNKWYRTGEEQEVLRAAIEAFAVNIEGNHK